MALGLTAPPTTSLFRLSSYIFYFHYSLSAIRGQGAGSNFRQRPTRKTWLRFLMSVSHLFSFFRRIFQRVPLLLSIQQLGAVLAAIIRRICKWGDTGSTVPFFAPLFALHEGYTPVLALVDTSLRPKRYTMLLSILCLALVDAFFFGFRSYLSDLHSTNYATLLLP